MAIVVRHPIVAKVDDRADFMHRLLEEYPMFLNSWIDGYLNTCEEYANDNANGDLEVKESIIYECLRGVDDIDDKKNLFYQSLFIMSFAYYESCFTLIKKETNSTSTNSIEDFCIKHGFKLSEQSKTYLQCIKPLKYLRNGIVHHNFGTFNHVEEIMEVSKKNSSIDFDGETLIITDGKIVKDLLSKMHFILKELCDKLNYKSKSL